VITLFKRHGLASVALLLGTQPQRDEDSHCKGLIPLANE